jgi:CHASE2 domain-containing sensor protein
MTKLVVLKLDGDIKQGFQVTLEISSDYRYPHTKIEGSLPPVRDLLVRYHSWQTSYRSLGWEKRAIVPKGIAIDSSLKKRQEECYNLASQLRFHLNEWLNSPSFSSIQKNWLANINPSESLRVLISTENVYLRQLPWHLWDFIEDYYPEAEIALCTSEYQSPSSKQLSQQKPIKILAILGNSEGIDVEKDKKILENLPNAQVTFLVEPQRQILNDRLWEKSWDILFFAGHSKSQDKSGHIAINPNDNLTLQELSEALKKTVKNGLQLAIFNSCDGLGLAYQLERLQIPQIVVMAEPVPDLVAQEFLKYFLNGFASGKSLYQAIREARKRLQGLEDRFPCASWLPVSCQNPAIAPFTYPLKKQKYPIQLPIIASAIATTLVIGMRSLGLFQIPELQMSDRLIRLRPDKGIDPRILVVEATEEDINRYGFPLPDEILAQAIAKLKSKQARVIGLDIFRDRPIGEGNHQLLQQIASDNFVAVCSSQETNNPNKSGIAPPPNTPESRLGFSDVVVDPDGVVRRHLMFMQPSHNDPCATNHAFSVRIALQYLAVEGIEPKIALRHQIKIGKTIFEELSTNSGAYQGIDDRGFQILLNYRSSENVARQVRLSEVLSDRVNPDWIENKIVLIGVSAPISSDNFFTPYSAGYFPYQKMPGITIQAQTTSQILSAVMDGEPLLSVWNEWGEGAWILGWSVAGGIVAWRSRRIWVWTLLASSSIIVLLAVCLGLLIGGIWVPLIPCAIALVVSGGIVIVYKRTLDNKAINND